MKFVVSRCAYCKLRRNFGFFCSVNHCTDGGASASHNVICSLSLAENDSRLFKNRIAMDSGVCQRKEGDVALFLLVTKMRKSRKICEAILTGRLLPETGRSQSNEP